MRRHEAAAARCAPAWVSVALAAVIFGGSLGVFGVPPTAYDALGYTRTAERVIERGVLAYSSVPMSETVGPNAIVPPVYPLLLAAIYAPGGGTDANVRATYPVLVGAQLLMALALVGLIASIGSSFGGRRLGYAAGIASALYLPFGWSASVSLTELLGTLGLAVQLLLALRLLDEDAAARRRTWGWFGLASAFVALTRPAYSLWMGVPLAFAYARAGTRAGARRGLAVFAAVFVLAMAPWWVRNAVTLHRFIPLRSDAGTPLFDSTGGRPLTAAEQGVFDAAGARGEDALGAVAAYRMRTRFAADPLRFVGQRLYKAERVVTEPWSPLGNVYYQERADGGIRDRIDHGTRFGRVPSPTFSSAEKAIGAYHLVLVVLALAGLAYAVKDPRAALVASVPVYAVAVHLFMLFSPRYFFPAMPAVILLAVFAGDRLVSAARRVKGRSEGD